MIFGRKRNDANDGDDAMMIHYWSRIKKRRLIYFDFGEKRRQGEYDYDSCLNDCASFEPLDENRSYYCYCFDDNVAAAVVVVVQNL